MKIEPLLAKTLKYNKIQKGLENNSRPTLADFPPNPPEMLPPHLLVPTIHLPSHITHHPVPEHTHVIRGYVATEEVVRKLSLVFNVSDDPLDIEMFLHRTF